MRIVFFLVFLIFFSPKIFSQDDGQPKLYATKLVKSETFNKINRNDLNFLIIGENNPKQGLELEFDDDKSTIIAGGYITSSKDWLFTVEGEFSSEDGVYFFDNKKGAKSAKFTFNMFTSFGGIRGFDDIRELAIVDEDNTQKTQRAFLKKYFFEKDSLKKIKDDYYILRKIMERGGLPIDKLKNGKIFSDEEIDMRPSDKEVEKRIKEYLIDKKKPNDQTIEKVLVYESKDSAEVVRTWSLLKNLKKIKVIEDYEKAQELYKNKRDSLIKKEIEFTKSSWNSKSFWYLGFSPSYQRENINIYNVNSTKEFDKRFDEQKGDLFNIQSQLNWFYQTKSGKYFLIRGLTGFGRGSNLSGFTKSTFEISEPTGQTINEVPIFSKKSQEAYTGNPYTYGFLQSYQLQLFGSLNKHIGLFTSIGYNRLGYGSETAIENEKKVPFRLGTFINLTSKKEAKTVLILQLFADRSNLQSDPSETDDWRFGFKIGLPVNISKEL